MRKYLFAAVVVGFLFVPASTFAATYCYGGSYCAAKVVYKSNTCSYYVAEDNAGNYEIFDWFGGNLPYVGNVLYGQWYSYGIKTIYNLSVYNYPTSRMYIAANMLSYDSLLREYSTYCPYY